MDTLKRLDNLFQEQVARTPDKIAVVFQDRQITYQELNQRSNQLANYLRSLSVKPEALVGICLERSHFKYRQFKGDRLNR